MLQTSGLYEASGGPISQLLRAYRASAAARAIIVGVALINVTFVLLHIYSVAGFGEEWTRNYRVDIDRGFAEIFNYAQVVGCGLLLYRCYVKSGDVVYLAWALVFTFVVLDDSLLIHERVGKLLDTRLGLPALPGLRSHDTGELIVWAAASALLVPALILGFRNSKQDAVEFGKVLTLIFALLVFFAVVVDMVHMAAVPRSHSADAILAVVEDGGEMLSVALALAFSLLLNRHLSLKNRGDRLRSRLRS
jgi:hypothetical protein